MCCLVLQAKAQAGAPKQGTERVLSHPEIVEEGKDQRLAGKPAAIGASSGGSEESEELPEEPDYPEARLLGERLVHTAPVKWSSAKHVRKTQLSAL